MKPWEALDRAVDALEWLWDVIVWVVSIAIIALLTFIACVGYPWPLVAFLVGLVIGLHL